MTKERAVSPFLGHPASLTGDLIGNPWHVKLLFIFIELVHALECEPVWPRGKALGW